VRAQLDVRKGLEHIMKKNEVIIILGVLFAIATGVYACLAKNRRPEPTPESTPKPIDKPFAEVSHLEDRTPELSNTVLNVANKYPKAANKGVDDLKASEDIINHEPNMALKPSDEIINKALLGYEKALEIGMKDYGEWYNSDGYTLIGINGYPLLIRFPTDISSISIYRYNQKTGKLVAFHSTNRVSKMFEEDDFVSLEINKECTALRAVNKKRILYYTLNDKQEFLFETEIWLGKGATPTCFGLYGFDAFISAEDKAKVAKYGVFYDCFLDVINKYKLKKHRGFKKDDIINRL